MRAKFRNFAGSFFADVNREANDERKGAGDGKQRGK